MEKDRLNAEPVAACAMSTPTTCIEVTEWCMSLDPLSPAAERVCPAEGAGPRDRETLHQAQSFSERLKLQLENLKTVQEA